MTYYLPPAAMQSQRVKWLKLNEILGKYFEINA